MRLSKLHYTAPKTPCDGIREAANVCEQAINWDRGIFRRAMNIDNVWGNDKQGDRRINEEPVLL